ncbi:hypothetical protein IW150_005903, partial [Coemansia sp. RSA 2607]
MTSNKSDTSDALSPLAESGSTAEELLAQLRRQLARYEELEKENVKLGQEQVTLENYVANMMASNVFTRSRKEVNYYEPGATDTDESEFEPLEDKPSSHPTRKPVARSVLASESKPASKRLSPEPKHDNVQITNKSVIDDRNADDDDDFKDDINSNASIVEGERATKAKPSLGKQISQAGSNMSIKTDCTTDTKVIEKEPPKKRPRGNSDSSDDEDAYSSSGSGDDFDSESDFGDKNCVVVIGKKKDTKVVKKTTATTASKKPVAKPTPTKTVQPISARTTSIASRPV